MTEMPAESVRELTSHLQKVLGTDRAGAEDLIRSAEPLWNAMERVGELVDSWGGTEFCHLLPRVLEFIRDEA